jgi:hypothetical protein
MKNAQFMPIGGIGNTNDKGHCPFIAVADRETRPVTLPRSAQAGSDGRRHIQTPRRIAVLPDNHLRSGTAMAAAFEQKTVELDFCIITTVQETDISRETSGRLQHDRRVPAIRGSRCGLL